MTMLFNGAIDDSLDLSSLSMKIVSAVQGSVAATTAISRAEAEFLFILDRTGQMSGAGFTEAAVRAVRDHLVFSAEPAAMIAEADVDWLLGMVGDRPTAFGGAVVFAVVRACDKAPSRLSELAMRAAVGRCLLV